MRHRDRHPGYAVQTDGEGGVELGGGQGGGFPGASSVRGKGVAAGGHRRDREGVGLASEG